MKIGVFDSGLGGLTVVQEMTKLIKGAEIFYIADTKNAPYGEKSPEEILQYSIDIACYLIERHQIDALILACNTATSSSIQDLRERYPSLIIIGTEPGIKPAIEKTVTGNVGVLATPATLKGEKYQNLVTLLANEKPVKLFEQACPGLVEQIEQGKVADLQTRKLLDTWLTPMRQNDVDTIVLGCTHYPLVAELISDIMEAKVTLIHTGEAIAKHLLSLGLKQGHVNEGELPITIYVTGEILRASIESILQFSPKIEMIDIHC